jgi:transmembrane sensor
MANEPHEIAELIALSLQAPLDEEQQRRLDAWRLANEENEQLFEKFKDGQWVSAQLAVMYESDKEAKQKKLAHSIVPRSIMIKVKNWYYYAAAACVLILLSIGYLWMNKEKPMPVVQQEERFKNDVPPGSDQRAMLVLADGRTIYLEQAKDGSLVQQGSVNVVKRGGELKYESGSGSNKPAAITYNTLRTPRGGQYQLVLPDGSKVWLNAATVLRFPVAFTGKERRVELSGEAYFEITKDATKPFKVVVNPGSKTLQEIEVLGTHFNVSAYDEEPSANTTLLEGSIRITSGAKSENTFSRRLLPGQRVIVSRSTHDFTVTTPEDPASAIAWVNGKFSFEKSDLASIMRELGRWYDIQVTYEGTSQTKKLNTGSGEIDRMIPLSELLSTLEQMSTTRFKIVGRTVKVTP